MLLVCVIALIVSPVGMLTLFPGTTRAVGPSLPQHLLARAPWASLAADAMLHMTKYSIEEPFRDIESYHHAHGMVQMFDMCSDTFAEGSETRCMWSRRPPSPALRRPWPFLTGCLRFLRGSALRTSMDLSALEGRLVLRHGTPGPGPARCGVHCMNPAPLQGPNNTFDGIVGFIFTSAASSGPATRDIFGDGVLSIGLGVFALASARRLCLRTCGALFPA